MQDPVFNALDIEFLQLRGFTVIKSPASDNLISLSTFLFVPYGELWGQMRVEICIHPVYPPLYIGNDPRQHSAYYCRRLPDVQGEEE